MAPAFKTHETGNHLIETSCDGNQLQIQILIIRQGNSGQRFLNLTVFSSIIQIMKTRILFVMHSTKDDKLLKR
jgi:hypothetical protein